jgi:hypothetical protein
MEMHNSYTKAMLRHSIRGTARPASHLWDGLQNNNGCDTENKTKASLTSPLMVSQVFAITFAFVSMAFSMPRLVFNI